MAKAKIINNVVVEIFNAVPGFSVEECFHPDVLKDTVFVSNDVQVNWIMLEDGTFEPPAETPLEKAPEA